LVRESAFIVLISFSLGFGTGLFRLAKQYS
jgi:hypothetical protein